jgi:hypothetical protein
MTDESGKFTLGLWSVCGPLNGISECGTLIGVVSDMHAKMMSARAFVTISCILSSLSVIFILSIILVKEDLKRTMAILAKVLSIGSLIAGIIGVALGISFIIGMKFNIGVSSILGIIASVFNLGGAIATLIIK